ACWLCTRRVLSDGEDVPFEAPTSDVAVTGHRCEHKSIVRSYRHPAQFGWPTNTGVSAHDRSCCNLARRVKRGQRQTISSGVSNDKLVGPLMQEERTPR